MGSQAVEVAWCGAVAVPSQHCFPPLADWYFVQRKLCTVAAYAILMCAHGSSFDLRAGAELDQQLMA